LDFDSIAADGLTKLYGPTRALSGVSLRLSAGEVTAIEGPNGSGKSTLLSLLSLLSRPTAGRLAFGAHDALSRRGLRARIGLLAHAAMVYPDLSGDENLALTARLYGRAQRGPEVAALCERFELGVFMRRAARTYSRGQLQRLSLARAVLHAPRLLLLDEPSTGLDERGVERLREVIGQERARGAIVVLVTHDHALAASLSDQRLRLQRGRVVDVEASA
jgi:heme exporter protein A